MRYAGFVAVVVACASPTETPEPGPTCGQPCVCGNGIVEHCYFRQGLGCAPREEECDGTQGASCTDYGYYGGDGVCSGCMFDSSGCDACAVACFDVPARDFKPVLAASQTTLAVAHATYNGPSMLTVLDPSLNEVASAQLAYVPVGIVAVPDGWLLVELGNASLVAQHVDTAGSVASSPQPIAGCGVGVVGGVAYGPGGRALVLCNHWPTEGAMEPGPGVGAFMIDANGTVVVQPFKVFPPAVAAVGSVTTDGISFFVAANGQLAVVSAEGGVSSRIAGYPTGAGAIVSWSGSSGWYVAPSDTTDQNHTAQAFDATGAKVGMPISIHTMTSTVGLQAFDTGLVGVSVVPSQQRRFAVARVDETGAVVATTEVGVVVTLANHVVVPFGSAVAVAWSTTNAAHVALVTP